MEARKLALITGFWANDGMNEKDTRKEALEKLEEQFKTAVRLIYTGETQNLNEEGFTEEDQENPFLAPAIKATREIEAPVDSDGTVAEAIGPDYDNLDQFD